jgi:Sulfotransferase family
MLGLDRKTNGFVMISPLFIIGNPRSGTTLLRLMLTNHKNIVIPPECGFAVWFYDKYKAADFSGSVFGSFVKDLSGAKKIETWNLDYTKLLDYIFAVKPVSYPELAGTVYEFYGHSIGRTFSRWGDKNNYYLHHIDTINEMYPSARFIHIIRDGRDIACSYRSLQGSNIESKYAPRLPSNINDIAVEWITNIQKIRDSFNRVGWGKVCEIRYEDLVSRPDHELKKICSFLEEPYDADMELYFIRNQSEHQEPIEFLQWKARTTEKPTTSEVGKFRNELTPKEIKEFESVSAQMLKIYNYVI